MSLRNCKKELSTCFIWDGVVGGNQLTLDFIKSLEESHWLEVGKPSKHSTKKHIEFLFCMFHILGKTCCAALTLSSKPQNRVVDFVAHLETKLLEQNNSTELTYAAITTKFTDACTCYKIRTS